VRFSRFESPYDLGDTISSFDPAHFDPALGGRSLQRRAAAAGPATAAGRRDSAEGPRAEPGTGQDEQLLRPAAGDRVGRLGQRQDGRTRGAGPILPPRVAAGGLNLGFNPPFNLIQGGFRSWIATRSRSRTPSLRIRGTPSYGIDPGGKFGYNWQWNASIQREIARNTTLEVGLRRQQGPAARTPLRRQPGSPRRQQPQRRARRLDFIHSGNAGRAALRPYGDFGNISIAVRATPAARSTTRCRRSS